jgi:hypothetical protein
VLVSICGWAQQSEPKSQPHNPAPLATEEDTWEYSLTVDGYIPADGESYATPTFTADHKWLHLEGRYNNEDLRTGSVWVGYNFQWGEKWRFDVTPMIGGVFGRTNGVAPGCEASVTWRKLTFSLDNEYVFNTESKSNNYYYSWPQVTYQALDWLRVGAAAQHTKFFQTETTIERGFLVGFDHKRYEFTTYVLNPGVTGQVVQLEVGVSF